MADVVLEPVPGVAVRWDASGNDAPPEWGLDGELEAGASLRVLSARCGETVLLLAALRPPGAGDHAAESVAAALVEGGRTELLDEALISTQYADDGRIVRVGLELYAPGEDYPVRAAGDAVSAASEPAKRRRKAELDFRLQGERGAAVYEIVEA